jgi:hypothetical protein
MSLLGHREKEVWAFVMTPIIIGLEKVGRIKNKILVAQ